MTGPPLEPLLEALLDVAPDDVEDDVDDEPEEDALVEEDEVADSPPLPPEPSDDEV